MKLANQNSVTAEMVLAIARCNRCVWLVIITTVMAVLRIEEMYIAAFV
jgi:hypothetical protein